MARTKEQDVVRAALEWARAERALRQNNLDEFDEVVGAEARLPRIIAECDRTEEELLAAAERLMGDL